MGKKITNQIKRFVEYLLGDRKRAIIFAVIFSMLPMLSWLSVVIYCLITLRKGAKEGFYVIIGPLVLKLVVGVFGEMALLNAIFALIGAIVPWVLAIVLRNTISWDRVINVGVLSAIGCVLMFHLLIPDTQQYWMNLFNQIDASNQGLMNNLLNSIQGESQAGTNVIETTTMFENAAQYATRLLVFMSLLSTLMNLLIARWMQSLLYNPSGLAKELKLIRVHWLHVLITALVLLGIKLDYSVAYDLFLVVLLPFIISGLSLAHFVANTMAYTGYMLISFYGFLLLFSPFAMPILAIMVLADLALDLRSRFIKQV